MATAVQFQSKQNKVADLKNQMWSALYNKAMAAGMAAGNGCQTNPMIVQDGTRAYFVEGGVCGFAWVNVTPGNSPFAKLG